MAEYYVIPKSSEADEQHVYVGSDLEVPGRGPLYVTELVADEAKNFVKVTTEQAADDYIVITGPGVRATKMPEDIKAESDEDGQIAPYQVKCDWDDTDGTLYWKLDLAIYAAEEHAETEQHDCQVVNAYNNDIEYIEYQGPEDEESEEEDSDDE